MESKERAPAIVVMEIGDCITTWDEVLLGIEEEGIPFRIQHIPSGEVIDSARLAARQSPCWLALPAIRKTDCALQNLPASAPLFTLMYQQDNHAGRSIGTNAARTVKGFPSGNSTHNPQEKRSMNNALGLVETKG